MFPGQFRTKLFFVTYFVSICQNKEVKLVLHTVHFVNGLWIMILINVPMALKKYRNSIKNTFESDRVLTHSRTLKRTELLSIVLPKMEMFNAYSGSLKIRQ